MGKNVKRSIFWEEEGFSTAGMAIALLLTLALIFTAARVYEVNTASAQVQETADAAALAAENTVAEFYIVASICDACVLSLSLTMVGALGLSVVCACIPPTAALSRGLLEAAKKIKEARDSFCDSANKSLEKLAAALPFLATVKAQEVLRANSVSGASYQGVAILAPWEMEDKADLSFEGSDEALLEVDENQAELEEAARKAEEAAERANQWKQHGYEHDSGSKEGYCMYQRAATLAGMDASQNPYFSSVDTWNFGAALNRAKAYYKARCAQESPADSSVAEVSNSALRKRFYAYAQAEVAKGYVHETADSFEAYFPLLPRNTEEMKQTTLCTDVVYPKTQNGGKIEMHAWGGCPAIAQGTYLGLGSIAELAGENSGFTTCEVCDFTPSSMGNVAAASTSIENGFEYHYREVAKAAEEYQKARAELDPLSNEVKGTAGKLLDKVKDAFAEACSERIDVTPPGHLGAVVLIADVGTAQTRFPSSFVGSDGVGALGARVAISSATLVKESSDEGKNVITSFLDGVSGQGATAAGAANVVLGLWSGMLGVYTEGHDGISSAIEQVLDSIPLASASGLGSWASDAFEDAVASVGFEPVDLRARKAVLVNSSHVLAADDSAFSARLLSAKQQANSSDGSGGLEGAISLVQTAAQDAIDDVSGEFTIATVVLFDGLLEVPITVSLPAAVTGGLEQAVQTGIGYLRNIAETVTGVRQWK